MLSIERVRLGLGLILRLLEVPPKIIVKLCDFKYLYNDIK